MEVLVEYDYKAQNEDELSIHKGDRIRNVTRKEEGWYEGEIVGTGARGVFPDNFVKVGAPKHHITSHLRKSKANGISFAFFRLFVQQKAHQERPAKRTQAASRERDDRCCQQAGRQENEQILEQSGSEQQQQQQHAEQVAHADGQIEPNASGQTARHTL